MEINDIVRKRGAPLGNQNARTHGFYSKKLSKREKAAVEAASNLKGLQEEIALVRAKIEAITKSGSENVPVLMLAISGLVKLLKAEHMLRQNDPHSFSEEIKNMLREKAIPDGMWPAYNEQGDVIMVKIQNPPPRTGLVLLKAQECAELARKNGGNEPGSQT